MPEAPNRERTELELSQALFYLAETNLKHEVGAVVQEEGAGRAPYALQLLQSEGELTIPSAGEDPETGKLANHEFRVRGR